MTYFSSIIFLVTVLDISPSEIKHMQIIYINSVEHSVELRNVCAESMQQATTTQLRRPANISSNNTHRVLEQFSTIIPLVFESFPPSPPCFDSFPLSYTVSSMSRVLLIGVKALPGGILTLSCPRSML